MQGVQAMTAREKHMRKRALQQIADAIEEDINGERIMKEVWEECEVVADIGFVEFELRAIVKALRTRRRAL